MGADRWQQWVISRLRARKYNIYHGGVFRPVRGRALQEKHTFVSYKENITTAYKKQSDIVLVKKCIRRDIQRTNRMLNRERGMFIVHILTHYLFLKRYEKKISFYTFD